jgi:hypothetical protein
MMPDLRRLGVALAAGCAVVFASMDARAAAVSTAGIIYAECVYGLESSPVPPLTAYVLRPDGTITRTLASSQDAPDAKTESAHLGTARFNEIALQFDQDFYPDPPSPTPDAHGLVRIGGGTITDTRRPHLAARRGDVWKTRQVYELYTVPRYGALLALVSRTANDPALHWEPAPLQKNAFAVCKNGDAVIGAP